jgi:hypothetical protein
MYIQKEEHEQSCLRLILEKGRLSEMTLIIMRFSIFFN